MLIASWPLQDFAGFLQIISWITLPVLMVAVLSTIVLHYYHRRKKSFSPEPEDPSALAYGAVNESYEGLKSDFTDLQAAYRVNESELLTVQAEIKRQDLVIDQLRHDVLSLEKNLANLRLALQLKEEQLQDLRQFMVEKRTADRPMIAAEIS